MNDSDNPTEILEAANAATLNLLPKQSRDIYLKQYETFMKCCDEQNVKKMREEAHGDKLFNCDDFQRSSMSNMNYAN
ncbi:hypothetical protein PV326_008702 [Microctonus aethiopoides]|nr:hypothetical protein PV326_008702 [Microctonus aethiopoides]